MTAPTVTAVSDETLTVHELRELHAELGAIPFYSTLSMPHRARIAVAELLRARSALAEANDTIANLHVRHMDEAEERDREARSALADVGELSEVDQLGLRDAIDMAQVAVNVATGDEHKQALRMRNTLRNLYGRLAPSTGKQPRPAAEAKCECGHAKMPGMTRCLNCNDLSPAAEAKCATCGGAGERQQCDGPTGHMEPCPDCSPADAGVDELARRKMLIADLREIAYSEVGRVVLIADKNAAKDAIALLGGNDRSDPLREIVSHRASPAAHTAQDEREAFDAGAILLANYASNLPSVHPWHKHAATLRRLAPRAEPK